MGAWSASDGQRVRAFVDETGFCSSETCGEVDVEISEAGRIFPLEQQILGALPPFSFLRSMLSFSSTPYSESCLPLSLTVCLLALLLPAPTHSIFTLSAASSSSLSKVIFKAVFSAALRFGYSAWLPRVGGRFAGI